MTHDDDISVPNKLAVFAIPRDDWQSITIPDGYASDADGAAKVIRREIDSTDFRPEHVWFDREMSAYFADGPSAEYKSPPRYSPNEAEEMAIVARTLSCAKSRDDAMMIAANTGVDARLARQWINERFPPCRSTSGRQGGAPCSSTPTGKGKAAMRKPQRLVVTPIVRPETQAAFILAQVAKSDIWYAEKFGPEHCTQCFSRAVSLGIVFG